MTVSRRVVLAGAATTFASTLVRAATPLQDWERATREAQARMIALLGGNPVPARAQLQFRAEADVENLGTCTRQLFSFSGPDGSDDRVSCYLMVPQNLMPAAPAILCLHQTHNSANQGMKEPVGLTGSLSYARELAERGYVTLTPNYGSYDEFSDLALKDPFNYEKHGYSFERNGIKYFNRMLRSLRVLVRAVDVLDTLPHAPRSIGAIGHSAGAIAILMLAMFEKRIDVIAESCGVLPWRLYACAHDSKDLSAFHALMPLMPADPTKVPLTYADILKALAPRPLWCNEPTLDVLGPGEVANFPAVAACLSTHGIDLSVDQSAAAINAARTTYERVFSAGSRLVAQYPKAPHSFSESARERAYAFFDEHCKTAPLRSDAQRREKSRTGNR